MEDPHMAVASHRARWVLTSAWLFLALGAFWVAGARPLTSGVLVAGVGALPPRPLFLFFSPRAPPPAQGGLLKVAGTPRHRHTRSRPRPRPPRPPQEAPPAP